MREDWLTRSKRWICSKFGHKQGEIWEHKGLNATCKRCNLVYKVEK